MSDFTSDFWSVYIGAITLLSIAACAVLLYKLSTHRLPPGATVGVMGHSWDEDLQEFNNPLPRWWMWMFVITIVFGLAYLALYPGLGSYPGLLHWTSRGEWEQEQAQAKAQYEPIYARYAAMPIPAVAADAQAHDIGERLFLNYCSQCHASDGRGSRGFPNLTDADWLYGGAPEQIEQSIQAGRAGAMPAFGKALGDEAVKDVANYVLSKAGRSADAARAARGQATFLTVCAACHGPEGKGNPTLGAPNLTDEVWLYGGSEATVIETISNGRNGRMPAWGEFLGAPRVHLLAAYIYGLSHTPGGDPAAAKLK